MSADRHTSDGHGNQCSAAAEVAWIDAARPLLVAYAEACGHLRDWDDSALWEVAAEFRRVALWLRDHEAPSRRLDEVRRAALRAAAASGRLALGLRPLVRRP